jgi:hypothetical protein
LIGTTVNEDLGIAAHGKESSMDNSPRRSDSRREQPTESSSSNAARSLGRSFGLLALLAGFALDASAWAQAGRARGALTPPAVDDVDTPAANATVLVNGNCTGTLVAADLVLSAGHCFGDHNGSWLKAPLPMAPGGQDWEERIVWYPMPVEAKVSIGPGRPFIEASTTAGAYGDWETFELADLDGGDLRDGDLVTLRTSRGFYVAAQNGGNGRLEMDRTVAGDWERFAIVSADRSGVIGDGARVALRTTSGSRTFYVSDDAASEGGVRADLVVFDRSATFRLEVQPGRHDGNRKVRLRTGDGRYYLTAPYGGGSGWRDEVRIAAYAIPIMEDAILLSLERSVSSSDAVPVPVLTALPTAREGYWADQRFEMAGWGYIDDRETAPTHRRHLGATGFVFDNPRTEPNAMLVNGEGPGASRGGDSGGPLYWTDPGTRDRYVIGICRQGGGDVSRYVATFGSGGPIPGGAVAADMGLWLEEMLGASRCARELAQNSERSRVLDLYGWFSPLQGDHFTTSDRRWAGCPGERRVASRLSGARPLVYVHATGAIGPPIYRLDYELVRVEGRVFSPAWPAPAGTVPIYTWRSRSRGDYRLTSSASWAGNPGDVKQDDYVFIRHEGYAYDSAGGPAPDRIPLYSSWSPSRDDVYVTTSADVGGDDGGYERPLLIGYVLPPIGADVGDASHEASVQPDMTRHVNGIFAGEGRGAGGAAGGGAPAGAAGAESARAFPLPPPVRVPVPGGGDRNRGRTPGAAGGRDRGTPPEPPSPPIEEAAGGARAGGRKGDPPSEARAEANAWISLRTGKTGYGIDPPQAMLPAVLGVIENRAFTPLKSIVGLERADKLDPSWQPGWMQLETGRVYPGIGSRSAKGRWVPGRIDSKGGFHVDAGDLRKWLAMPWDDR